MMEAIALLIPQKDNPKFVFVLQAFPTHIEQNNPFSLLLLGNPFFYLSPPSGSAIPGPTTPLNHPPKGRKEASHAVQTDAIGPNL